MFWNIEQYPANGWIYDVSENRRLTYSELGETVSILETSIASDKKLLVTLFVNNSFDSIAAYLAILRSGHTVMLLSDTIDISLKMLILKAYRPDVIICFEESIVPDGYIVSVKVRKICIALTLKSSDAPNINPDCAVLLSTSGTTGSPKFVRLSYLNIQSNASSITKYLEITPQDTAITSLPFSYSYGFSIINSQLLSGANIVCTDDSVLTGGFWNLFKENLCTSFAGVPYSYLMLERLRFDRMELPSLQTLTQAGGRLSADKIEFFANIARSRSYRFYVMYGQTEASPRISYVPYERLLEKIGSVGIAIPGGDIKIVVDGVAACDSHVQGEIVYSGTNVMLGYALTRADLQKGDELNGILHTGDIGYMDTDGYLYITGRVKRFIKVFGLRLNMDDVEQMLENALSVPVACVGRDDNLYLMVESCTDRDLNEAKRLAVDLYKIHHSAVHVHVIKSIPVNSSGKKDYSVLHKDLGVYERS